MRQSLLRKEQQRGKKALLQFPKFADVEYLSNLECNYHRLQQKSKSAESLKTLEKTHGVKGQVKMKEIRGII